MDISQLKTLIHVAELGSLSKASDRLSIAQPALSRQIRLMEKELGVDLFERHGRGMVITQAGQDVLDHAVRIMAEMEAIRRVPIHARSSYRGKVTVGTTPTVAEIITVPLLRKIKQTHPALEVRFSSAFSGHLLDWLQRGDLDLAVSYDPKPLKSLRVVPVMMESLLFVGSADDRFSLATPVPFSRLAEQELVMPSPRHGLRAIMDDCARQAGVELCASVEADSFGVMIDLVRNGFGPTMLPLAPIHHLVEAGVLSAAPLVDPAPARKLVLAYPVDRPTSPAARFVENTILEITTDLVRRGVWMGELINGRDM